MNKNELIASVAQHSGLSKQDASKAIDAMISSIEDTLKSGGDVGIVGFGTFSVTNRAARTGRNPRTGDPIQIAASKQPKFKAGAPLKAIVNNR
jgi:DNA-binding protein HU-beta